MSNFIYTSTIQSRSFEISFENGVHVVFGFAGKKFKKDVSNSLIDYIELDTCQIEAFDESSGRVITDHIISEYDKNALTPSQLVEVLILAESYKRCA